MEKHHHALCQQLLAFCGDKRYCDFEIVPADGTAIPCHKVVMAAMSPFFDALLNNEMKETQSGSVDLHVDAETASLLMKYIYTGQNVITKDSVAGLYDAANFLEIASLVEDCEQFLKTDITEEICLEIWIVSKKFNSKDVAEISRSMVLKDFARFVTYSDMESTPLEDLIELLTDPYLNCTGTSKCKAAWLWIVAHQNDEEDEKSITKLINALVKAENVVNADILEACKLEDTDPAIEEDMSRLQSTWDKVCKKLWITTDTSSSLAAGPNYNKDECFVVLVSDKSGKNKLMAFNFKKQKWYDLEATEQDLGHRFAICARNSELYVSGGTKDAQSFLMYRGMDKQWIHLEPMTVGREQHVMHYLKNRMYVLGGSFSDGSSGKLYDVNMYNFGNQSWTKSGTVAYPVVAACSAQIEGQIILLGGAEDGRAASDILQLYDTETNFSSRIDLKLPFKAKSHTMSVTSLNNSIYIVHNADIYFLVPFVRKPRQELRKNLPGIQRVGPQIDKISKIEIAKPPLKGFAVASFGSKILVIGGEDGAFATKSSIIQFDTETNQSVLLMVKTPFPMKDMHCTNLFVPRSWVTADGE